MVPRGVGTLEISFNLKGKYGQKYFRELKIKNYSQKNYIKIINIFRVIVVLVLAVPSMWVGYDDVMISLLLKMLNFK